MNGSARTNKTNPYRPAVGAGVAATGIGAPEGGVAALGGTVAVAGGAVLEAGGMYILANSAENASGGYVRGEDEIKEKG